MKPNAARTGRFQQPGLLGTVTRTAVVDGTAKVIMNTLTSANGRRRADQRRTGTDGGSLTDLTPPG